MVHSAAAAVSSSSAQALFPRLRFRRSDNFNLDLTAAPSCSAPPGARRPTLSASNLRLIRNILAEKLQDCISMTDILHRLDGGEGGGKKKTAYPWQRIGSKFHRELLTTSPSSKNANENTGKAKQYLTLCPGDTVRSQKYNVVDGTRTHRHTHTHSVGFHKPHRDLLGKHAAN